MSVHTSLIKLVQSLGFPKEGGVCNGFTIRWIEACILGEIEEKRFEKRTNTSVRKDISIIKKINKAKKKQGKNLTQRDQEFIDIEVSSSSMMMFHSPEKFSSVYNVTYKLGQEYLETISSLASSQAILDKGGLISIFSLAGIYTTQELADYLHDLWMTIKKSNLPSSQPIGILLGSLDHMTGLMFTESGWKFMDINQYTPDCPSKHFSINETSSLAASIQEAFPQIKCDIFLMASPQNNCHMISSGTKLYLYKDGDDYCYFIYENGEKTKFQLSSNLIQTTKEFNQQPNNPVALKDDNFINAVISETSKRKHSVYLSRDHSFMPLHLKIITTGNDFDYKASLIADLEKFRDNNLITDEMAKRTDTDNVDLCLLASAYGNEYLISELMKIYTNFNVSAITKKQNPLRKACIYGYNSIVRKIAEYSPDLINQIVSGNSPLSLAITHGYIDIVKTLLDLNAEVEIDGKNILHFAAESDNPEIIQYLAKLYPYYINEPCKTDNYSPLITAASQGKLESVKTFLALNADINQTYKLGRNAFHLASINGHLEVVKLLAMNYPHLVNHTDERGASPLMLAAINGRLETFKYLLDSNANIDQEDKNGGTALFAAAQSGNNDIFKELIKRNANDKKLFTQSRNELIEFAKNNNVTEKMERILERNLSMNDDMVSISPYEIAWIMGKEIDTPLDICIQLGKWSNIDAMPIKITYTKQELSTRDFTGKTLLQHAIENKNTSLIKQIISSPDCNEEILTTLDKNNLTPLHFFINNSDSELVDHLAKNPHLVKATAILVDHYINLRTEEHAKLKKELMYSFFQKIIAMKVDVKINAARKMKHDLSNEKIDAFTHDEIIALRTDRLGDIMSLLKDHQLPKGYVKSLRADACMSQPIFI